MTTTDGAGDGEKWPKKGGYSGAFPASTLGPPPKTPSGTSARAFKKPRKKAS